MVAVAASIDIRNAFNMHPWTKIKSTLLNKIFPRYLRRILHSYLSEIYVEYIVQDGTFQKTLVTMGVPQGSVIGPYLWNITYDKVLRVSKLAGCEIVCYADDTLIVTTANNFENAKVKMCIVMEKVLSRIEDMGFQVALQKTEITAFWRKAEKGLSNQASIRINGVDIPIKMQMKYLGMMLDNKLYFDKHMQYVTEKATKVSRALSRLMPNLRGSSELKRKLYYHVVQSIVMYGAPIWSTRLMRSVKIQRPLRKI